MDWQIPLAVGNIVVVVGGVVWAFARLSASMATLTRSIERLDSTVEKLAKHSGSMKSALLLLSLAACKTSPLSDLAKAPEV